jgi:branched-chain amino acid transport system substrate-binding protein
LALFSLIGNAYGGNGTTTFALPDLRGRDIVGAGDGRMPNMVHAGMYSATLQYLKAVQTAGTKDADAVAKKLKELPVDDAFTANGHVQANGRMGSDVYLFEVKKPSESKRGWDYYKLLATVPGDTAYPTAADSGCPLTK